MQGMRDGDIEVGVRKPRNREEVLDAVNLVAPKHAQEDGWVVVLLSLDRVLAPAHMVNHTECAMPYAHHHCPMRTPGSAAQPLAPPTFAISFL